MRHVVLQKTNKTVIDIRQLEKLNSCYPGGIFVGIDGLNKVCPYRNELRKTEKRWTMHATTASNLRNAHGGESMAHMRYQLWGKKAEEEGFPNVARLFLAISFAEMIHASNHFYVLGDLFRDALCCSAAIFGLGNTSQNLQGGIK